MIPTCAETSVSRMTPADIESLVARLKSRAWNGNFHQLCNPDGDEAATALLEMAGEIERLKRELLIPNGLLDNGKIADERDALRAENEALRDAAPPIAEGPKP